MTPWDQPWHAQIITLSRCKYVLCFRLIFREFFYYGQYSSIFIRNSDVGTDINNACWYSHNIFSNKSIARYMCIVYFLTLSHFVYYVHGSISIRRMGNCCGEVIEESNTPTSKKIIMSVQLHQAAGTGSSVQLKASKFSY